MKRLIALVAMMLATNVNAQSAPVPPITFSPVDAISLVISGIRFFHSESTPKEIVVIASGTGKTENEAVNNALINAVQKGIGVLIVSDQTVKNGEVVKNLAAMYSSGVVNSYDVKECKNNTCTVIAKVSPWQFIRRLEGHEQITKVNGKNLHAQALTAQHALVQRYILTDYYLSHIRQSGLDVFVREVKIVPSMNSETALVIDYEVKWNPEFKKSVISYLQRLEKDTNGKTEENLKVFIQWGPTGIFDNRVFINTYDPRFRSLIMNYLHNPIFIGIKEFGICERFDLTSDVFKIDWYGFRKQKTIILDTKKLQNIDKISMSIGCAS